MIVNITHCWFRVLWCLSSISSARNHDLYKGAINYNMHHKRWHCKLMFGRKESRCVCAYETCRLLSGAAISKDITFWCDLFLALITIRRNFSCTLYCPDVGNVLPFNPAGDIRNWSLRPDLKVQSCVGPSNL